MTFDEPTLRRLYEAPPVGDTWSYDSGSLDAVKSHVKETVAHLDRSALIHATVDYSSHGSGYASYVPVFCSKRDRAVLKPLDGRNDVPGIVYYLSLHAPFFIFHEGEQRGGNFPHLSESRLPEGDWYRAHQEALQKLRERGFSFADQALLDQRLPFPAKIDTVFNDPPYTIFDLLFHWMD